jgi:hypothetical protein
MRIYPTLLQEWELKHLLQSPRAQQDLIDKVGVEKEGG